MMKKKIPAKKNNQNNNPRPHDFRPLLPGDLIQIIAPASSSNYENLLKGAEKLALWGYRVKFSKDILKPELFLANSDEYRMKDLISALNDNEVKAIWCFRGGYGSLRLLPHIKKTRQPKNKKLIIGLSDITSLQIGVQKFWNWPSLHTSLIDRIAQDKLDLENLNEIRGVLDGTINKMKFENLTPINSAAKQKQTIKGTIIGGNLMVAVSTLGTPSQIESKGKILFFEELSERGYRIDRCLQQLKQANIFKNAKGIVFGDFTSCEEPNGESIIKEVIHNFSKDISIPVLSGIENGHGDKQRPLFFNTNSILNCGKNASLIVESPYKR
jgi:muramoyltetrapeptide carboxypeptidase